MKAKPTLGIAAACVLASALTLTGCSSAKQETPQAQPAATAAGKADAGKTDGGAAKPALDTSKPVKLTGYLLGTKPAGFDDVLAELNKKLQKDLNATMDINYIGWGDVATKYPLLFAGGDNVDWVFAANWNYYGQEAAKGAFLPITEDMLKTYMPKHYVATDKLAWKQALVNGKDYMIPTATPDRKTPVFLIRGDLRKKYNIPEIKKFSDIEPYLAAIKKNNPDMVPMNLDSQYEIGTPFYDLREDKALLDSSEFDKGAFVHDVEDPSGKIYYDLEPGLPLDSYTYAADTMKKWYDAGYINKNPFANKVRSKDVICDGKTAVAFGNSVDSYPTVEQCKAKGIDLEMIPVLDGKGHSGADPFLNNGVAIAANSKNPERTMAALDLIMEDPAYNYLVYFGIEGKNYKITADGKIGLPDGVTPETNTYPPDAAGFWFTNKDQFKPMADWSQDYIDLRNHMKDYLIPDVYASFTLDDSKIKTETANITNVIQQYALPIQIGAVKDVKEAISNLDSKFKAAGIDKVKAEITAQTSAYLASNK